MAEALVSSVVQVLVEQISNQIRLALGDEGHARKLQSVLTAIEAVLGNAEERQVEDETVKLWLKDLREVASEAEDVLGEFEYEATKKKVRTFFYISNPIGFKVQEIMGKLNQIEREKDLFRFDGVIAKKQEFVMGRETFSFVDDSGVVGRERDRSKIVDMLLVNQESGVSSVICIVGIRGLGKTTLAKLVYNDERVKMHFDLRMWVWVSHDFDLKRVLVQMLEQISNQRCELSSLDAMMRMLRDGLRGKRFLLVLDDVCTEDFGVWDDFKHLLRFGAVGSRVIVTAPCKAAASLVGRQIYPLEALSEEDCWALFERETFILGKSERTPDFVRMRRRMIKRCGGLPLAVKTISGFMRSKKEEHERFAAMSCEIRNIPVQENKIMEALKWTYDALPTQVKQCLLYFGTFPKNHWAAKEKLVQLWMAQGYVKESSPMLSMEDVVDRCIDNLCSKFLVEVVENNASESIELCKVHVLAHDFIRAIDKYGFRTFEDNNQIFQEDLSECQHLSLTYNGTVSSILQFPTNMKKLRSLFLRESHGWGDDHMVTFFKSSNSKSLRVLDLSSTSIKTLQLPTDKLKILKYLDLSHTDIEELPEFVSQLYNLQTLRLEQCKHLEKLPDELTNLVNLRHLHIDSSGKWEEMPQRMDRLFNLQILPIFILSKEEPGRSIKELERLEKLQGRLEIFRLEDAEGKMFAKKGVLRDRKNVHTLSLHWSDVWRGKNFQRLLELLDDEHDNDVAVLERLQPHPNLKKLKIRDFRGAEFPRWLTTGSELSSLVEMHLWGCYKLKQIPCFGELPSLKVLHLHELKKLKRLDGSQTTDCNPGISNEQEATAAEAKRITRYPSLKQLVLVDLLDLEEWLDDAGLNSPSLERLTMRKCPNLRKTPNSFPSLKRLVFKEVNGVGISSITSCLSSLTSLSINGCNDVEYLPEGMLSKNNRLESISIVHCRYFQGFPPISEGEEIHTAVRFLKINDCCNLSSLNLQYLVRLRELIVSNCEELESLEGLHFLTALEKLKLGPLSRRLHNFPFAIEAKHLNLLRDLRISGWPNLKFLPNQLQHLTTLKFLWIRDFNGLTTLPEWLEKLSSLQRLVIQNCQNLMQLPPEKDLKRLTSLMKLYIGNCLLLQEERNLSSADAEWHKISQFPVVKFEVPSHLIW